MRTRERFVDACLDKLRPSRTPATPDSLPIVPVHGPELAGSCRRNPWAGQASEPVGQQSAQRSVVVVGRRRDIGRPGYMGGFRVAEV